MFFTYFCDFYLDGRESAFIEPLLSGNIAYFEFIDYPTRNYRIFAMFAMKRSFTKIILIGENLVS
jgi:hypothetical protein